MAAGTRAVSTLIREQWRDGTEVAGIEGGWHRGVAGIGRGTLDHRRISRERIGATVIGRKNDLLTGARLWFLDLLVTLSTLGDLSTALSPQDSHSSRSQPTS